MPADAQPSQYDQAALPLLQALASAGIDPEDFGRHVGRAVPGVIEASTFDAERAVPILLQWLPRITDERVKEAAARHLKTKAAKGTATQPLILEFTAARDPSYKWALADTLSYVADASQYDALADLAADSRHGPARQMLISSLWRLKTPRAEQILLRAISDPDVALHAMSALRRMTGNTAARPHIAPLADHPDNRVRTAARHHLRKITHSRSSQAQ